MSKRYPTEEEQKQFAAAVGEVMPLDKKLQEVPERPQAPPPKVHRELPIAASRTIDLHGMTLDRAYGRLMSFVEAHAAAGGRDLLVITGKSGELARQVPLWLKPSGSRGKVALVAKAPPHQGGEGALIVTLKSPHNLHKKEKK